MNKITEIKQRIEDWIGNDESWLDDITDGQAEEIYQYLEENHINIENNEDMDKIGNFVNKLIFK